MKVKVNNLKLLKKGGDIPKFKKPSGKIVTTNYGIGATARDSSGKVYWEWAKPKSAGYSSAVDRAVTRARLANNPKLSVQPRSTRLLNLLFAMRTGNKEQKAAALSQYYSDKGDLKQAEIYAKAANYYRTGALNPSKLLPKGTTGNSLKPINPRGRRNKTTPVKTTTLTTTTVLPVTTQTSNAPETTTTVNAPMYLNLLSDMTMYKNNPDTFVERFGNLNGNYTGFASKTPGLLYATSIKDMTDEARNQYLSGLKGLYDMYLKDPTEAINYAKYNFFTPSNNATVGDYAQAQLNGTKPQTPSNFLLESLNWYANNKPTIDNYFNNNTNYSQDFSLRVLNFLDRYKLYRPKYTFARKGSKLILRNK